MLGGPSICHYMLGLTEQTLQPLDASRQWVAKSVTNVAMGTMDEIISNTATTTEIRDRSTYSSFGNRANISIESTIPNRKSFSNTHPRFAMQAPRLIDGPSAMIFVQRTRWPSTYPALLFHATRNEAHRRLTARRN